MFRLKLHKWLFSLAVIASLGSYSGYANTASIVVTNTEWIQTEAKKANAFTYYLNNKNNKRINVFSYLYYEFQYSTILLKTKAHNHLLIIEQEAIFNHLKTARLNSLLKPYHITNTASFSVF